MMSIPAPTSMNGSYSLRLSSEIKPNSPPNFNPIIEGSLRDLRAQHPDVTVTVKPLFEFSGPNSDNVKSAATTWHGLMTSDYGRPRFQNVDFIA